MFLYLPFAIVKKPLILNDKHYGYILDHQLSVLYTFVRTVYRGVGGGKRRQGDGPGERKITGGGRGRR